MAVEIIATDSANTTGASSVVVPIPAETVIGDSVYVVINMKRAGGSTSFISPTPTGWNLVHSFSATFFLYQEVYTTTPPANETFTFGHSDVHCLAYSITIRGFLEQNSRSYRYVLAGLTQASVSSLTFGMHVTDTDDTLVIGFYGTSGASITVPAEQTSLFSTTQTGPPALGIASGSQAILTKGTVVGEQTVTLSGSSTIYAVLLSFVPADAEDTFSAQWDTPILLTDAGGGGLGALIFDTVNDYVYYCASTESSEWIRVWKFDRAAFTHIIDVTFTGYGFNTNLHVCQDANYLYIVSEGNGAAWIKVDKSDLSLAAIGAIHANTNMESLSAVGPAGLVLSGGVLYGIVLFDIPFDPTPPGPPESYLLSHFVSWSTSGGIIDAIPVFLDNSSWPTGATPPLAWDLVSGPSRMVRSNQTSIWDYNPNAPGVGALVVGGGEPVHLSGFFYAEGTTPRTMAYNEETNTILISNPSSDTDITTGTQIWRGTTSGGVTYLNSYNGVFTRIANGLNTEGTWIQEFQGTPSIFTPWYASPTPQPTAIVQYNFVTGEPVRSFPMQATYGAPFSIVLSPDLEYIWMVSSINGATQRVHRLHLSEAVGPPPGGGGGGTGIDPYVLTYGTRWGLGMGLS